MPYGIINVPVTDVRAGADSNSESLSQALFGVPIKLGKVKNAFTSVILPDKYSGWVRVGHINRVSRAQWEEYFARPKRKVKSEIVIIKNGPGTPIYPFRLFFGTELVIASFKGELHFELPPGNIRAPIGSRCLLPSVKKQKIRVTGKNLVDTASRFIGVPYLWGGITPCGFDCSGLVKSVYGFHGISVPRDSKDQEKVGEKVDRNELQPGDLLFFPGHVAISCGQDRILHASASRGMVSFDSLNPQAQNYRADLDKDYLLARRLL